MLRRLFWVCLRGAGGAPGGDSGRGRVQICHKGAPDRDRRRRKARNINVSSRVLRLGRGLCGRFGQSAASDWSGRASAGRAAGPALTWTTPPGLSGPRERRSGKEFGARTGPRGSRPSPGPAIPSPTLRERVGFQSNAQERGTRSTGNPRARHSGRATVIPSTASGPHRVTGPGRHPPSGRVGAPAGWAMSPSWARRAAPPSRVPAHSASS